MKLSISLAGAKKGKAVGAAPPLKKPAAFSSFDDDDPIDAAPTDYRAIANKTLASYNDQPSQTTLKRMEAEKQIDATVYDYDEVWDKMQEAKERQKEALEVDAKERKPKYIHGLLTSAATRKLDHLRAEEKMMQLERLAEGDEFKDKEQFVTQAYKDQMEEVRKAEEEEKRREELLKKKRGASGMAHFYRQLLNESEIKHEATVAATQKPIIGPQPNLTITKPLDLAPKSDMELAQQAREKGREVELNDDNQIVDRRDLLAPGLNLAAPNTRRLGLQNSKTASGSGSGSAQTHRAVGTASSRKEIQERRAREIQQQMDQEQERVTKEKKRAQDEADQRFIAKRNNEEAVESARERYLQRKRQRLMEPEPEPEDPA